VTNGQALFALEHAVERAALQEGERRLAQAQARLEDLRKGRRPSEVASLEARLAQARASLTFTAAEAQRWEQLGLQGVASASELERARAAREGDARLADQLEAELATARLGARPDEIVAAEAEIGALEQARVRLAWSLDQKRVQAPVRGLVQDTYYLEGEYVAAGMPVVALLPPENLKVRFFIPEPVLGRVLVGAPVRVRVDGGDPAGVAGRIRYVSPQAEYTPPVIYSRENRGKLVFMAEAMFEASSTDRLHPGQPAEVELIGP
jgi:HlyD family secretion protein